MEFKSGLVAFALLTVLTLPGLSWGDDSASDPEELTPCEKMAAKCEKRGNKWGECLPRDNYNGDACCQKGSAWKCGIDMTVDERISKDPAYAKMINCVLAGHPDLESLKKCVPLQSECKIPEYYRTDGFYFERCPKFLKCLQRKHSDWVAFWKCGPQDDDEKKCKEPLSPIENTTEANAPLSPIETATDA